MILFFIFEKKLIYSFCKLLKRIGIINANDLCNIMTTTGKYPKPRNDIEECIFDDAASYEFESIIYVTEENVHGNRLGNCQALACAEE